MAKPRAERSKASAPAPVDHSDEPSQDEDLLQGLSAEVAAIFSQCQHSLATHRKLVNRLHKVFLKCATIHEVSAEKVKLVGEKAFRDSILACLDRVVVLKKGITQADRVFKFIATFCHFATEHEPNKDKQDDDAEEATPTSRFLSSLVKYLYQGFDAKNKVVRWRCVQLLAYVVESMAEMDDDMFVELRDKLLVRARDKESIIRQQASISLMKFRQAEEEQLSASDDDVDVTDTLTDLMCHDPSTDVRRAILHNLAMTITPKTLPPLLTRVRDVDPVTRRTLFRSLCSSTALPLDPSAAFNLPQRHTVVQGLDDRDEGVRKEAGLLVAKWLESSPDSSPEAPLSLLAVTSPTGRALSKSVVICLANQCHFDSVEWTEDWWAHLTPEKACLIKSLVEKYRTDDDDMRLEKVLPVVTALAFRIESAFLELTNVMEAGTAGLDDNEDIEANQIVEAKAFIVAELLSISLHADYGDEMGRRRMFTLLRTMVANPQLPYSLIPLCLDVLLKISTGERDFMRVVVELVQELRELSGADASLAATTELGSELEDDDEDGDVTATGDGVNDQGVPTLKRRQMVKSKGTNLDPEKAPQHLRMLAIVGALLERVTGSIQDNTSLYGIVHELIIPAVRSKEPEIREEGLLCLGLCCFLDKGMAMDSFPLLAHQSKEAEGELRIKVLQILFDLFMLFGVDFLVAKGIQPEEVVTFLIDKLDDTSDIQSTAAVGFSKLMLSGLLTDTEPLKALVLVYFSPETNGNQLLRQCLSYFFPAYCFSSPANQKRLVSEVFEDQEEDQIMLSPLTIGAQLFDWTDPTKVIETPGLEPDIEIHLDLAIEMVKQIYQTRDKDQIKLLCQLLSKLSLPDTVTGTKVASLSLLITSLNEQKVVSDTVSRNALNRFHTSLTKKFGNKLTANEENDNLEEDKLSEVRAFITDASSRSNTADSDESDEEEVKYVEQAKKLAQKSRMSILSRASTARNRKDRESTAGLSDAGTETTEVPRRSGRARMSVKSQKQAALEEDIKSVIGSDTDSDDDDDNDEEGEEEEDASEDELGI